jgi:hypothetical protein
VDAGFGPYPDQFAQDQHRFGPFQPIKDAVRRLQAPATDQSANINRGGQTYHGVKTLD